MDLKYDWHGAFEERSEKALETGFRSDLKIIILNQGRRTEIKAHKIFLQMGSPVLDKKIQKLVLQHNGDNISELVIENVDPAIFKMMMKHFYTGKSEATTNQALALQRLAKEYEVNDLAGECENLLGQEMTEDNILTLFESAIHFGHKPLIQKSLNFICRNGTQILKLNEFSKLSLEHLIKVVKQDELIVESEMEIFEAVYKWGQAECSRELLDSNDPKVMRKILEKVLKYVRFPLMKSEEFVLHVGTKNLLGMEEQLALLMSFLVSPEQRSVLSEGRFISNPRANKQNIIIENDDPTPYEVSREIGTFLTFLPSKTNVEILSLSSSKPFTLTGLKFNGSCLKNSIWISNVTVELRLRSRLNTIRINSSLSAEDNYYYYMRFEKEHQILVEPSDCMDLKIKFNYNPNAPKVPGIHRLQSDFLNIATGYGCTLVREGRSIHSVLCEGLADFLIEKPPDQSSNEGFINSFIVNFM